MAELIERDLSYVLNGCVYDVHNEVGPGLREECYQKAMEIRLAELAVPFNSKPRTRRELVWLGEVADVFEPDLVASDRVILELKVNPDGLPQSSFRQTINYLKSYGLELGLLVNFALAKAAIRRVVFHEPRTAPAEHFEAIRGQLAAGVRDKLSVVRDVILRVHQEFGLGYSDSTYRKLIEIGIRHQGLRCESQVVAEPVFRQRRLPASRISPLCIEESILVQVEAIHDGVSLRAVRTMQTHIRCMDAAVGVVASFGQSRFELRGVKRRFEGMPRA